MKIRSCALVLAATTLTNSPLPAQLVNDGAMVTLANVTTNITGTVTVGTNGAFTSLVLADNALLTNSAHGVIGLNAAARSNQVRLASPTAQWLMGGTLFVGSNGSFSTLVVNNGALLRANAGIIGRQTASGSNVVLVTGAGSMWSNVAGVTGVGLTVGSLGSGNQLIVSNGGWVVNASGGGSIGSNGSNNVARVTGPGSVWSNRFALNINPIGAGNANNGLVIENGGQVFNDDGLINGLNGSSNNFAFITGNGAVWNNSRDLYLGGSVRAGLIVSNGGAVLAANSYVGSGGSQMLVTGGGSRWSHQNDLALVGRNNTLVVTNGGSVVNSNGNVGGLTGGDVAASNNTTMVTGAGSTWSNRANLSVGFAGPGNRLVVTNSGLVAVGAQLSIGEMFGLLGFGPTNSSVTVDGGTLRVANPTGNGRLAVFAGTNLLNSGAIEADFLLLTNVRSFFEFNGGLLATRGAAISNGRPFVVGRAGGATWDVRASASNHVLAGRLIVGSNASFNQVFITNGATLQGGEYTFLAFNSGSNNAVRVSGPGSTLHSPSGFFVGADGNANQMFIGHGGKAIASAGSAGTFIGRSIGTRNNAVTVADPGSQWSINDTLFVGAGGNANQLVVSNGARVDSLIGHVGSGSSASNNVAIVTGANSSWSNRSELTVGSSAGGNRLMVTDGGTVINSNATLGLSSSSRDNAVLVSGTGSLWDIRGDALIGRDGRTNQLMVSDGGTVVSGNGLLGFSGFGGNNTARVTGPGSLWSNRLDLHVGHECGFNALVVSNQSRVMNRSGVVGFGTVAGNNGVVVTDAGSSWSNSQDLIVGGASAMGFDNGLLVTNGGAAFAGGSGIIGLGSGSSFSFATVTDPGSRWVMEGDLHVGSNTAFNQLIVANGAAVSNRSSFIGDASSSVGNIARVAGAGSVWDTRSDLYVGLSSRQNLLTVEAGGRVVNSNAFIGFNSSSNTALLTGAGSFWSNRQTLVVGQTGSVNRVVISNSARWESRFVTLGVSGSASNNEVVVTGPGSFWRVEQSVTVGASGPGNRVVITNGGKLRTSVSLGQNPSSRNNELIVTGPGSSLTNGSNLNVGSTGSGNRLLILDGGLVHEQPFGVIVGTGTSSTNNRLVVDGGTLRAVSADGFLDVRRGTNVLNAGLIDVTRLLLTNTLGRFEFNGGTLSVENSRISHGTLFLVGNGVSPATFLLAGNGLHEFIGILAAQIRSNATFTGNGTITGPSPLQFLGGSRLMPGTSIGKMVFSNSPSLQGTTIMEISRNGAALTNDHIQIASSLTYGGSLVVSNIGPTALAAGDSFGLFAATNYAGSFSSLSLPALGPGLGWNDKLLVDGSIEVVAVPEPKFASITLSGTNVIISGTNGPPNATYKVLTSTNVTLPLSNWVSLATNQFDPAGGFSFTDPIVPGIPQRFIQLRTP